MRRLSAIWLTWDYLIHAGVAAALVLLYLLIGKWALPVAVTLIFMAREAEQQHWKHGTRWQPWRWGWHVTAEWVWPAVVAVVIAAVL